MKISYFILVACGIICIAGGLITCVFQKNQELGGIIDVICGILFIWIGNILKKGQCVK
jgi:uncharacterized membrane protein (UPF0136 family)